MAHINFLGFRLINLVNFQFKLNKDTPLKPKVNVLIYSEYTEAQ